MSIDYLRLVNMVYQKKKQKDGSKLMAATSYPGVLSALLRLF
jgi:hypothetical protein